MATSALAALERCRDAYEERSTARKLDCLRRLARARLATPGQVQRLHEALAFLRAYPDSAEVLRTVRAMLVRFDRRADLRAHRDALAYTGIAGTVLWFPFFHATAQWLVQRWPRVLVLERADAAAGASIAHWLPALLTPLEGQALREMRLDGFAMLDAVRGRETDAAFLVRRVAALPADERTREAIYDAINPSCELHPAAGTPSRTRAALAGVRPVFQRAPLRRARPDLVHEATRAPRLQRAAPRRAEALIALARGAMATRRRDLDAFAYANPRDVWWAQDDGGLAFALIGMRPERRAVVAATYGGLTLQNGVPIGYHQTDLVGGAAAIAFNTFDTFRGGEAAHTFARLVALLATRFGARSFGIDPYQLGHRNDEGLASGAWWFYAKLGFRPRAGTGAALARSELARRARSSRYRTPTDRLRQLAQHAMFFDLDRRDPAPQVPLAALGLAVAQTLSGLGGSDRAAALARVHSVALRRLGLASLPRLTAAERRVWDDWAPLIALLPDGRVRNQRDALLRLVRAKAAPSERGYALAFARLPALADALALIARRPPRRAG